MLKANIFCWHAKLRNKPIRKAYSQQLARQHINYVAFVTGLLVIYNAGFTRYGIFNYRNWG